MPPRSPLPLRHGLSPAWVCTPQRDREPVHWEHPPTSMGQWLRERLAGSVEVDHFLATERFVYADGRVVREADPYGRQVFVWFHRDLRPEPVVPGEITVVHRDDRIVVVDKPPFLSTIPRGNHVLQSLVVRLREELDLPELAPMHRLDRVTSGLVLCTIARGSRAAYQAMFEAGTVAKTYRALAPTVPGLGLPTTVRNHIRAIPGTGRAEVVAAGDGVRVNAETVIEVEEQRGEVSAYRLSPRTGRTHQLRLHLAGIGAPILNDPLYPVDREVDLDDFSSPLQLLASELAFTDPVDGRPRRFVSRRELPLRGE